MLGGNVITADHWSAVIVANGSKTLAGAAPVEPTSWRRSRHPGVVTSCDSVWRFGTLGAPFFPRDDKQAQCLSLTTCWAAASVIGSIANVVRPASKAGIPKRRFMMVMLSCDPDRRSAIAYERPKADSQLATKPGHSRNSIDSENAAPSRWRFLFEKERSRQKRTISKSVEARLSGSLQAVG